MYHPAKRQDAAAMEFVELYNSQPWPEDISGFQLSGAVKFMFPVSTVLPAEGVLVVALDPAAMRRVHGLTNVTGPYSGKLENRSDRLRLLNRNGAVLLETPYTDTSPWPVAADGAGHSLVLARPSWGEDHPRAWAASDLINGSPGRLETIGTEPLREVMINELLAHTAEPEPDFIELYNPSNQPADLSGCHLTDDPATNKFTFGAGVSLGPRGFLALDQSKLGFAFNSGGESVYLLNRAGTRVLDVLRFGAQAQGVAFGLSPDGSASWSELSTPTPGQPNTPVLRRDVVISEILYAPLSRESDDQFVELHNRGAATVDLSQWRFVAGIDFIFSKNTTLAPGGYLVVARNATRLLSHYPNLNRANVVGDFQGRLSGGGERLALAMPETVVSTHEGVSQTSVHYIVVNEVTYGTGGRWSPWAKGGGSSLELIDPRSDNHLAENWATSDESAKADWTSVEFTGRLDNATLRPNALEISLMGAGECLLDDVEVIDPTGVNLLSNPSFSNGLAPWVAQGNHEVSFLQSTGGVKDGACLHVFASGGGDPAANRIRVPLPTPNLALNTTATLRAKVRWLRGHPEILLRLYGNSLEAFGSLTIPANPGTPGAANTRSIGNAGPAIFNVRHEPVLPAADQPVLVTARLRDPDGMGVAVMRYRIDPDTNTVMTVPMLDDGTGGDAVAGDGLFSATLPGRPGKELVAFYVQASDNAAQPTTTTFPADAPVRECLIRFGETQPASPFATYRIWLTKANTTRWSKRLKLSDQPLDATFVHGDSRAIYNAGALYAGAGGGTADYTGPLGQACDYKLIFPEDDRFLGSDEAAILWPGLSGNRAHDLTGQQEQTAYWVAASLGLPFNYQRHVKFFVNGTQRNFIMLDTQKPGRDAIQQWFPTEADGDLFKIQSAREYDINGFTIETLSAKLGLFTTTDGVKKTAAYRRFFSPRAADTQNHFDDLFNLVDAMNGPTNTYTAAVEELIDVEQWMRTFAVEHVIGNWDSYGYGWAQNMYAYKPRNGRWKMIIWDVDVAMLEFSDPPTADLFKLTNPLFPAFDGDPAVVGRMYKNPKFARAYWRAVQDAVSGPLLSVNVNTFLDPRTAILATADGRVSQPNIIKNYLSARLKYCLGQLAKVAADFRVNAPDFLSTNSSVLLLSGTAPVAVRDLAVNGVTFPVTWTSVTSWTARVELRPGTNELVIQGLDHLGFTLDETRRTNTVLYTGSTVPANRAVLINEWMASNVNPGGYPNPAGGSYDDWFELHNTGPEPVDLTGYFLTDDLHNPFQFQIPAGHIIPSRSYLLVWADGQPARNKTNTPDLHVGFQLAKAGESLGLFASDGQPVDTVTFGPQTSNFSQGRFPDGGSVIHFMTTPSPRADNVLADVATTPVFTTVELLATGDLELRWQTISGRRYRLEYKNDLNEHHWSALGDYSATGSSLTIRDRIGAAPQRFYRVW